MTERTLAAVLLSAVLLENIVLARAMLSGDLLGAQSYRRLLRMGVRVTAVCVLGGLLSWLLGSWLELSLAESAWRRPVVELVYLASAGLAYTVVLRVDAPSPAQRGADYLQGGSELALQLGVPYAVILFGQQQSYPLLFALAWFFASGLGFTLALLLCAAVNERLSLSSVPRAFKGLPVRLVYAGILSMAIYALVGHQLPT